MREKKHDRPVPFPQPLANPLAAAMALPNYEKLGAPRYYVSAFLFLMMMSLPIKMLLRWIFNLKYIVGIPEFFFNI